MRGNSRRPQSKWLVHYLQGGNSNCRQRGNLIVANQRSSRRAVSSLFEDALGHADVLSQFTRPGQGAIDATNQMVDAIGMIQAEDRGYYPGKKVSHPCTYEPNCQRGECLCKLARSTDPPRKRSSTHLVLQDSRSGQGRQFRFTPPFGSSWTSSTRESGSSRRSSRISGNDASGGPKRAAHPLALEDLVPLAERQVARHQQAARPSGRRTPGTRAPRRPDSS